MAYQWCHFTEKLHEASAAAARAKKQQNQKQKLLKQQVGEVCKT